MLPRRDRAVLWAFALVVLAWMAAQALTGIETGLVHLLPALVLALPLICGRYPGEDRLAALAGTPGTRTARVPVRISMPHSHVRVMQRGGRLVACALAKRPPPPAAPLLTA